MKHRNGAVVFAVAVCMGIAAASGWAQTPPAGKGARVEKTSYGTTKDGQAVDLYTLTNARGVVAKIME